MGAEIREAVLALRRAFPRWGPKKLRAVLVEREARREWPAASTMGDLLHREGLSLPRRRVRYGVPLTQPLAAARAAERCLDGGFQGLVPDRGRHAVRSVDGDRRVQSGSCSVVGSSRRVSRVCDRGSRRTFREYGLPRALRTDNGSPFATTGAGQLSHLAVWVVEARYPTRSD